MKVKSKKLAPEEIECLGQSYQAVSFPQDVDMVYEEQVPNLGLALLQGEIFLTKKTKVVDSIGPGHLIGIYEILNNLPVSTGCRVKKGSEIIILGKSDIYDLLKNPHTKLHLLIKDYST